MEISGGPVLLHPPPFSGIQNYKFNKLIIFSAYHTNSLAHLRRALYMECTLVQNGCTERNADFPDADRPPLYGQFTPSFCSVSAKA